MKSWKISGLKFCSTHGYPTNFKRSIKMKYKKLSEVLDCDYYLADREGRKILSVTRGYTGGADLKFFDYKVKSIEMNRDSEHPCIVIRLDFMIQKPNKMSIHDLENKNNSVVNTSDVSIFGGNTKWTR